MKPCSRRDREIAYEDDRVAFVLDRVRCVRRAVRVLHEFEIGPLRTVVRDDADRSAAAAEL